MNLGYSALAGAVVELAKRDLNHVTRPYESKKTVERHRKDAKAFFDSSWYEVINELATYLDWRETGEIENGYIFRIDSV